MINRDFFKLRNLDSTSKWIVYSFTLFFFIILVRTAWISDDAAITLRTVLNCLHGFGPNFNIDERVQGYTHPLWFIVLLIASSLVENIYYATFIISIVTSVAAFFLLISQSSRIPFTIIIALTAISSKCFIDFSTSGLENPLSHLFIILVALTVSSQPASRLKPDHMKENNRRLTLFFLMCSGLYLTRPDLLLIVMPIFFYMAFCLVSKSNFKSTLSTLLITSSPVVLWTFFSLFYYGFPLPNTAYAKLGMGIPIDERLMQGIIYLVHSIDTDPVTIFVIMVGFIVGFCGDFLSKLLSAGVLLYLIYIISIGGDFMEGRFLSAIFFTCLIILTQEIETKKLSIAVIIPILFLGSNNIYPNILDGSGYTNLKISDSGIADERGFYYQSHSLLNATRSQPYVPPYHINDFSVAVICGGLGFSAINGGPGIHYIDSCGLTDPLLARLPARQNPSWRIGHFVRQIPTNYKLSIKTGVNLLGDQKTKLYWDSIRYVTRGNLFDKNRLLEIVKINLGFVEKPDFNMYRYLDIPVGKNTDLNVSELDISSIHDEGTAWNAQGSIIFDEGVEVQLSQKKDISSIDISVDNNDIYEIFALQKQKQILLTTITPTFRSGLSRHKILLPNMVSDVDKILIQVKSGDGNYSIGHLVINPKCN